MKYILSYLIFCLSFVAFMYCLMMGPDMDAWMGIGAIGLAITGIITDTLVGDE